MNADALYLRQDVQVEPLVDQWYAWSHLISPATAARNITERHLKIMDSYVEAPELHASAVRNPAMLGGPFIDYNGARVDEVRALAEHVRRDCKHLVALSHALVALDHLLAEKAKGFGLEPLYPQVPEILRGYVELVYDLNNNPSYRLLEPLLYRSPWYSPSLQSLMLSISSGDARPFVLSTPRLESPEAIHWHVPFADAAVDELFKTKASPQPFAAIRQMVGGSGDEPLLRSFLTDVPPVPYQKYQGSRARWRYFGHACVLVETPQASLLFDPVISYTYDSDIPRYTYLDLPDYIDYVLISHNHQDHVLYETLLQLRHKVGHIIVPPSGRALQDPSLKLQLEHAGFTNVLELDALEEVRFANGRIVPVPFLGEHCDLDIRSKSGYLVTIGGHSMLFAADSCNIEPALYRLLHREFGDVEVLFLGMECAGAPLSWVYGPLLSKRLDRAMDQSRRYAGSDFAQAQEIVETLGCREVYVYAMGQEPWLNHVMSLKYSEASKPIVESNRLLRWCQERGVVAERLFGEREMFVG